MDFLGILFGIILLSQGGDLLTKSSVDISLKLSIPKIIIGMTVVSFATSAPELIVSLNATLDGLPNFAIGNVLGSNIANIGLVLGLTIFFSPINISKDIYKIDWPIMMFSALYFLIIILDGKINFYEGSILIIFLIISIVFLIKNQEKSQEDLNIKTPSADSLSKSSK